MTGFVFRRLLLVDHAIRLLASAGLALPNFLVATVLIYCSA